MQSYTDSVKFLELRPLAKIIFNNLFEPNANYVQYVLKELEIDKGKLVIGLEQTTAGDLTFTSTHADIENDLKFKAITFILKSRQYNYHVCSHVI